MLSGSYFKKKKIQVNSDSLSVPTAPKKQQSCSGARKASAGRAAHSTALGASVHGIKHCCNGLRTTAKSCSSVHKSSKK